MAQGVKEQAGVEAGLENLAYIRECQHGKPQCAGVDPITEIGRRPLIGSARGRCSAWTRSERDRDAGEHKWTR